MILKCTGVDVYLKVAAFVFAADKTFELHGNAAFSYIDTEWKCSRTPAICSYKTNGSSQFFFAAPTLLHHECSMRLHGGEKERFLFASDSQVKGFPCLPHSKVSQSISVYVATSLQLTAQKQRERDFVCICEKQGFRPFPRRRRRRESRGQQVEKINACICLFSHQLQCFQPLFTSAALNNTGLLLSPLICFTFFDFELKGALNLHSSFDTL